MNTAKETTPVRDLMPERFTRLIADKAKELLGKAPDPARISSLVSQELHTSKYWAAVEEIALQASPEKYKARMEYLKEFEEQHKSVA